jgi:hypothetical protein
VGGKDERQQLGRLLERLPQRLKAGGVINVRWTMQCDEAVRPFR